MWAKIKAVFSKYGVCVFGFIVLMGSVLLVFPLFLRNTSNLFFRLSQQFDEIERKKNVELARIAKENEKKKKRIVDEAAQKRREEIRRMEAERRCYLDDPSKLVNELNELYKIGKQNDE